MSNSFPVSRRRFVATAGAALAGAVAGPVLISGEGKARAPYSATGGPALPDGVFTLGVASGEPAPFGVVLWTRLAPDPINGGGMPDRDYLVWWEVAEDDRFRRVRAAGLATATPDLAHSVHAEVIGLLPDREYFYRFRAGRQISPVGRTRTAPAPWANPQRLRFAFASCQDFQAGYYTALRHLATEDIAFVAHLGDYIYENFPNPNAIRMHQGTAEPYSLTDYRNSHAQYKTDLDLQAAHAAVPWIVSLDDHELDNNWADEIPQDPALQTPEAFRARRAAAFQAFYEHLPLRRASVPRGIDMRLYRRLRYGSLASLHVLDTRQYRSDQPANLAEAEDPARSMTGAEQETWLVDGMRGSHSRWNVLANQVMWATNDRRAGPEQVFDFDNWDGYRVQRRRLLEFFGANPNLNPVVLTGDRHATWVCDLRPDFDDPTTPAVGAEITGSSVTSGGDADPVAFHNTYDPVMAESPHWKYIDNRRGYVVCDLTRDTLLADLRVVSTVRATEATISTGAQFVVEAGRPGIEVVSG